MRDSAGEVRSHIALFADISEQKISEEHVEFLVQHDALTGLPNRLVRRENRCDEIQGGFHSRPLPAVEFAERLRAEAG